MTGSWAPGGAEGAERAEDALEQALRHLPLSGEDSARRFGPPSFDDAEDADVLYLIEETVLGPMVLAGRRDGVLVTCAFALDADRRDRVPAVLRRLAATVSPRVLRASGEAGRRGTPRPAGRIVDEARRQLDQYLAGRRRTFDLRLEPATATPFQRSVLDVLPTAAGYGQRISYGRLAARLGRPKASRAVGNALGENPLCVVLPCHRVVGASGALTGYAGGLEAKQLLLDLESARE